MAEDWAIAALINASAACVSSRSGCAESAGAVFVPAGPGWVEKAGGAVPSASVLVGTGAWAALAFANFAGEPGWLTAESRVDAAAL
jgi:hypothetical protein